MSTDISINKGLDIKLKGAAKLKVEAAINSKYFAVIPSDFHGVIPKIDSKRRCICQSMVRPFFFSKSNEAIKFCCSSVRKDHRNIAW